MDSFLYNSKLRELTLMNRDDEPDQSEHKPETKVDFSGGILEIHIHHARNIHNICIYDNQDVYAKFSLTYNPDQTLSTSIIPCGGKNPDFNQTLPPVKVNQAESVLKCEMWMMSRAPNYMEDQLLGFALVQLSEIVGNGKVTADYILSSTDLFHSPAGTVRLSLKLDASVTLLTNSSPDNSSIASEVVLLDMNNSGDPTLEYSRIEFPDINVAVENQQMVSDLFRSPGGIIASFLKLGSSPLPLFEHDTSANLWTTSRLGDDVIDSAEKKPQLLQDSSEGTTTSRKMKNECREEFGQKGGSAFKVFPTTDLEAEQSAMQQQIVGIYMRSMKQFTESLAKMKLPMDVDKIEHEDDHGEKKKDGSARVFYGSRAFF